MKEANNFSWLQAMQGRISFLSFSFYDSTDELLGKVLRWLTSYERKSLQIRRLTVNLSVVSSSLILDKTAHLDDLLGMYNQDHWTFQKF